MMAVVMDRFTTPVVRWPHTVRGKAAVVFGLYAVAAVVAGVVSLVPVPLVSPVDVAVAAVVVAVVLGRVLVRGRRLSFYCGILAAAALALPVFFAVPASVLALRGETVRATVIGVQVVGHDAPLSYQYEISGPAGQRIKGHLAESSRSLQIGDPVRVVVDPDGWVGPETSDDIKVGLLLWIVAGIGLVASWPVARWIAWSADRHPRLIRTSFLPKDELAPVEKTSP